MEPAPLETIQLEHLPPGYDVHVALFRNVKNSEFLQRQLLEGNAAFEYALVDAAVVISRIHALSAVFRAVNDLLEDRLRSRNVHSEVVFCLSPNNNIASSFRTFGITPTTATLLLIKVTTPTSAQTAASIQAHISSAIEGDQIAFSDAELQVVTDWGRVKKIYKLNNAAVSGPGNKQAKVTNGTTTSEEDQRKELEALVLGSMALRGY